jgi:diguanylate cyclase (GGDEF)-like protein/PAS domain S-box-containing protein
MLGSERDDNLADAVADILVLVDADGIVLYINPAGAELLGHPREMLPGRSVFEVVHPDDLDYARTNFAAIRMVRGVHGPIRVRVLTASGEWRTLEMLGSDATSDLGGVVISCRDITDSLREASVEGFDLERLRRLVDASGDLVLLLGRDDTIQYANAAVGPLLGYRPSDVIGRSWLDLVHPDDLHRLADERTLVRTEPGATMRAELRLRKASLGWRRVEVDVVNERDNPAIEGIVVTARDVTLLRRAQERLARALATAEVGVLELDVEGRISEANEVLLRLTESDATELLGRLLWDCFEDADQPPIKAAVEWLLSGEDVATGIEGRWHTHGAEPHWMLCRLTANRDTEQNLVDLTCFLTDISRRKQQEANLRELNEELARYATHDALTDLPNRFLFNDHLTRALGRSQRAGTQMAVLFCDLDWFKEVNDTLGHAAGDDVLVAAADRLRANLRPTDVLARLGGDEFAVLADQLPSTNDVIALANRMVQALGEPIAVAGTKVQIGLSVGIALSKPESTPTSLLQEADRAVYEAKARGRGRYAFPPPPGSAAAQ